MTRKRPNKFLHLSVDEYRKLALENPLRAAVMEYLRLRGYPATVSDAALAICRNCGSVAGQRVDTGWPDLVACEPGTGRLIAVELKTLKGKLRPSQVATLAALREAGALVVVPRSLEDLREAIEKR